jgi:hypothetical protein
MKPKIPAHLTKFVKAQRMPEFRASFEAQMMAAMAEALEWATENLEDREGAFLMVRALDTITALRGRTS